MIIYPLHPVEILQNIAQHLNTHDILSCILVCKVWSNTFRPVLWDTVVASSSGPDFFTPQNQLLLRHIRHLDYRIHPSDTRLPTLGFTHLESLKICPPPLFGEIKGLDQLWTPLTAILYTLSNGPFSTLELSHDTATADFWEAVASCKHLRTLVLKDLAISRDVFQPFWRACHLVERLVLDCATVHADKSAHRWHRKRLARLKHIVLKGNSSALKWTYVSSLPWMCAPYLETIHCSSKDGICPIDMNNLVTEIEDATQAAREGKLFYVDSDEMAQEGGGSELHIASTTSSSSDPAGAEHNHHLQGLVPGKQIREFQCGNLPRPLDAGDLHKILSNMDALEKLCVRQLIRRLDAPHELAALSQHMETLVELDIWGCALEQSMLVSFLEQCPRLQVFVADSIHVLAAAQSRLWACTGLRVLRVRFLMRGDQSLFSRAQDLLLERLAGMPCLERFYIPECCYRRGLEHLPNGFAHVHDVFFPMASIDDLTEEEARWMVKRWPALRTVRVPAVDGGLRICDDAARVLEEHGIKCLAVGQCP